GDIRDLRATGNVERSITKTTNGEVLLDGKPACSGNTQIPDLGNVVPTEKDGRCCGTACGDLGGPAIVDLGLCARIRNAGRPVCAHKPVTRVVCPDRLGCTTGRDNQ